MVDDGLLYTQTHSNNYNMKIDCVHAFLHGRFGHTIPVGHHVDVEIVQDEDPSVTHTWTDYQFGAFSDWYAQNLAARRELVGSFDGGMQG